MPGSEGAAPDPGRDGEREETKPLLPVEIAEADRTESRSFRGAGEKTEGEESRANPAPSDGAFASASCNGAGSKPGDASGSDSNSDSDSDGSSDSNSDSSDSGDEETPVDGLSSYERLRQERIKRNQERLAALGLHQAATSLKPQQQPKRPKARRRSIEPVEPTRTQRSRLSKKRIDYAEKQPLFAVRRASTGDANGGKAKDDAEPLFRIRAATLEKEKHLTPEERARNDAKRERRRKEKKGDERVPRFVYDEFQRIRSARKKALKKASRQARNASREVAHWSRALRKLETRAGKLEARRARSGEALARERARVQREARERAELDLLPPSAGWTLADLLLDIEEAAAPGGRLFEAFCTHEKEQSERRSRASALEKERAEANRRRALERKLGVLDALDRFPRAYNEAVGGLNAALYARAPREPWKAHKPPCPVQKPAARRSFGTAFGGGSSLAVAGGGPGGFESGPLPPLGNGEAHPGETTGRGPEPPRKKPKRSRKSAAAGRSTAATSLQGNATANHAAAAAAATAAVDPGPGMAKQRRKQQVLPLHTAGASTHSLLVAGDSSRKQIAGINTTTTTPKNTKKRNRSAMGLLPLHSRGRTITAKSKPDNKCNSNQHKASPGSGATPSNRSMFPVDSVAAAAGTASLAAGPVSSTSKSGGNKIPGAGPFAPAKIAKKPKKKQRDARYIGGWISPRFARELDRNWLARTRPIDSKPVVVVPEDALKRAGVQAKKTAVFDLASYVPQAGDVVLYYPSAHKDVLATHFDTLGSRQRNLLRVPLWARASRDRNRLTKEDEKGIIWWTDEWIESLSTVRRPKKDKHQQAAAETPPTARPRESLAERDASAEGNRHRACCLGDYPIICRVEKTHVEFPEDPYAKGKSASAGASDTGKTSNGGGPSETSTDAPAASWYGQAAKKAGTSPQLRLCVLLKPLTPIAPPSDDRSSSSYNLGLPPNFSVVTFPVVPPLEPFLVPFCWGYTTYHTMVASETVWIRLAASTSNDPANKSSSLAGRCGKGKIIDFLGEISSNANPKTAPTPASVQRTKARSRGPSSGLAETTAPTVHTEESPREWNKGVMRLDKNTEELRAVLEHLAPDGSSMPKALEAQLLSDKNSRARFPLREANVILGFLRRYVEQKEQTKGSNVSSNSEHKQSEMSKPSFSLLAFILRTLPLRRGVLVSCDSNRRLICKASPWNLVTLQPTDLSRSLQSGLLGVLDNSLREKAILCIWDVMEQNPHARLFSEILTELKAPGYYSAVPIGMSLDRILARLKAHGNTGSCYYTSIESILMDLNLISENCLLYNNPESELVAMCSDIVLQCQVLMKDIIQNTDSRGSQKRSESDFGGKKQLLAIPSDLNTPYHGNINGEWLRQYMPYTTSNGGEQMTHQASSSVWIPQCGEEIFYSRANHSKFVSGHIDSLDDVQRNLPEFGKTTSSQGDDFQNREEANKSGGNQERDDVFEKASSHWMEGTVISVRTSFPKEVKNQNAESFPVVTSILIVELHLRYSFCEETIVVCWRPCQLSTVGGTACKACGLSQDSFLKPARFPTNEMQIIPTDAPRISNVLPLSKDTSVSIVRCFDFLKKRCIDGIAPDIVNSDVALEKAENGVATDFDSHFLPSYPEFFSPSETKICTRGIKKVGCLKKLKNLSEVGYMPLWSFGDVQKHDEQNTATYKSFMPSPFLCLELVRLRILNGHYMNVSAIRNDISEAYVASVLFVLSEASSRSIDRISTRRISKHLLSAKLNGKISKIYVKKKSKKKTENNDLKIGTNQNAVPQASKSKGRRESTFEKLSEEEDAIINKIILLRKYHAAAIVFALEANNAEKIFCLTSTTTPTQSTNAIPDVDTVKILDTTTPQQLEGIAKIRRLLQAVARDACRNRFKFANQNFFKFKMKCGDYFITENGQTQTTKEGLTMFKPSIIIALLPDGSVSKLRIRCGNEFVDGESKVVDQFIAPSAAGDKSTSSKDPVHPNHSTVVGRNNITFKLSDLKDNEELARSFFGRPGRLHPCVRCQSIGETFLYCRVQRGHSNPDYNLMETFKSTSGVDSLLIPWKRVTQHKEVAQEIQRVITKKSEESNKVLDDLAAKEIEENELAALMEKQVLEARENFESAKKAQELSNYLHRQAILLSDLEVKLSENFIVTNFPFDPRDNHYTFCIHCGCAGDLLLCEGCSNVSHPKCAGLETVPEGDWFCNKCISKSTTSRTDSNMNGLNDATTQDNKQSSIDIKTKGLDEKAKSSSTTEKGMDQNLYEDDDFCKQSIPSTIPDNDMGRSSGKSEVQHTADGVKLEVQVPETGERDETPSESCIKASGMPMVNAQIDRNVIQNSDMGQKEVQHAPDVVKSEVQVAKTDVTDQTSSESYIKASRTETDNSQIDRPVVETNKVASHPEIDDHELEKNQSELDKLLANLIDQRVDLKPNDNHTNVQQKPSIEQKPSFGDPLDILDDSHAREFLSFISIKSAAELFSMESVLIAKDLEQWRKEKGMKPLAPRGSISTVNSWKKMVRARSAEITSKMEEHRRLSYCFQSLPSQAQEFCSYIGITDPEVFVGMGTKELSKQYSRWRKKRKMSVLNGTGSCAYVSKWKSIIRKALPSYLTAGENSGVHVSLSKCHIKNGFKVRKLFEDGNYYMGQVVSGPAEVLEEENGRMVLCWKVKYEDDDEEEFTLEELELWGIDKPNRYELSTSSETDQKSTEKDFGQKVETAIENVEVDLKLTENKVEGEIEREENVEVNYQSEENPIKLEAERGKKNVEVDLQLTGKIMDRELEIERPKNIEVSHQSTENPVKRGAEIEIDNVEVKAGIRRTRNLEVEEKSEKNADNQAEGVDKVDGDNISNQERTKLAIEEEEEMERIVNITQVEHQKKSPTPLSDQQLDIIVVESEEEKKRSSKVIKVEYREDPIPRMNKKSDKQISRTEKETEVKQRRMRKAPKITQRADSIQLPKIRGHQQTRKLISKVTEVEYREDDDLLSVPNKIDVNGDGYTTEAVVTKVERSRTSEKRTLSDGDGKKKLMEQQKPEETKRRRSSRRSGRGHYNEETDKCDETSNEGLAHRQKQKVTMNEVEKPMKRVVTNITHREAGRPHLMPAIDEIVGRRSTRARSRTNEEQETDTKDIVASSSAANKGLRRSSRRSLS